MEKMRNKYYIILWISLIFLKSETTAEGSKNIFNRGFDLMKNNPKTSTRIGIALGLGYLGKRIYNKSRDKKKVEILNLNANLNNDKLNLESNQSKNEAYSSTKEEVKKNIENKESRTGIKHKVIKKTLRKPRTNHKIRSRARR
jgi:hypothetical protein